MHFFSKVILKPMFPLILILCLLPVGNVQGQEQGYTVPAQRELKQRVEAPVPRKAPIPIELWFNGEQFNDVPHDGMFDPLTLNLLASLEKAFRGDSYFILSHGRKRGTMLVKIPSPVTPEVLGEIDKNSRFSYTVEFASNRDKSLGTSIGTCINGTVDK